MRRPGRKQHTSQPGTNCFSRSRNPESTPEVSQHAKRTFSAADMSPPGAGLSRPESPAAAALLSLRTITRGRLAQSGCPRRWVVREGAHPSLLSTRARFAAGSAVQCHNRQGQASSGQRCKQSRDGECTFAVTRASAGSHSGASRPLAPFASCAHQTPRNTRQKVDERRPQEKRTNAMLN
jgi:hypothetical protein